VPESLVSGFHDRPGASSTPTPRATPPGVFKRRIRDRRDLLFFWVWGASQTGGFLVGWPFPLAVPEGIPGPPSTRWTQSVTPPPPRPRPPGPLIWKGGHAFGAILGAGPLGGERSRELPVPCFGRCRVGFYVEADRKTGSYPTAVPQTQKNMPLGRFRLGGCHPPLDEKAVVRGEWVGNSLDRAQWAGRFLPWVNPGGPSPVGHAAFAPLANNRPSVPEKPPVFSIWPGIIDLLKSRLPNRSVPERTRHNSERLPRPVGANRIPLVPVGSRDVPPPFPRRGRRHESCAARLRRIPARKQ
jgi:hypothetical protein